MLELGLTSRRLLSLTLPVLLLFRYVTRYCRSSEKMSLMFSWRPSLNTAVSGSVTYRVIFLLSSLTSSLKSGVPMSAVEKGQRGVRHCFTDRPLFFILLSLLPPQLSLPASETCRREHTSYFRAINPS